MLREIARQMNLNLQPNVFRSPRSTAGRKARFAIVGNDFSSEQQVAIKLGLEKMGFQCQILDADPKPAEYDWLIIFLTNEVMKEEHVVRNVRIEFSKTEPRIILVKETDPRRRGFIKGADGCFGFNHVFNEQAPDDLKEMYYGIESVDYERRLYKRETTFKDLLAKAGIKPKKQVDVITLNYEDLKYGKSIGAGSLGEVFEGTYCGDKVAIKTIGGLTQVAEQKRKELMDEAKVLQNLQHPNIVRFYGAIIDPPAKACIVLELATLGTLHKLIHRDRKVGELEPYMITQILHQVASALFYLHSNDPPV